jgi:predicted nuclease with TOPRIM domain
LVLLGKTDLSFRYYRREMDKVKGVQKDVEEVQILMTENISKVSRNIEDLENLQTKSEDLRDNAKSFKKQASTLKRTMCLQDMKSTALYVTLLIVVLTIIGLAIWLSARK